MIPFDFYRLRLTFRAEGVLRFPTPAGNLLRGGHVLPKLPVPPTCRRPISRVYSRSS